MTREEEIRARLEKATPGPWNDSFGDIMSTDYMIAVMSEDENYSYVEADADLIANAPADIDYLLKENEQLRTRCRSIGVEHFENLREENQRLQKAIELSTNLHEGRRQTTKHMEELYKKAVSENKRLQDANNTMAAYLQSLANPDAWSGRTYIRGFRDPWVYADDALRYAGIEEREPRQTPDGAE